MAFNVCYNRYASWHLNETSGTNVPDNSGNGRNGTTVNTPIWAAGKLNNCLQFDGSTQYVTCGNIANFERTDSFSVDCWIKTLTVATTQIVGRRLALTTTQGWDVLTVAGVVAITLSNSTLTPNALSVRSTNAINNNVWRYVAITYSGTSLPTGVSIYIDGTKETNNVVANTLTASVVNNADCSIGSRNATDWFFSGSLDELVVYNRVLTQAEVTGRYNAGIGTEACRVPQNMLLGQDF